MRTDRFATTFGAGMLAGLLLLLSGCSSQPTEEELSSARAAATSAIPVATSNPDTSDTSGLSAFEQQLPLQGNFVSQLTETTGSVLIERRSDGLTWATLSGFSTGEASDLRLYLKEGALEQDTTGAWGDTAGYSFEIAPIDSTQADQEIAIPGAHTMPAIQTLTVMNYASPDFPSFGSVALSR